MELNEQGAAAADLTSYGQALADGYSKDALIAAWRSVNGTAGDTARISKAEYAGKLASHPDRERVKLALAASITSTAAETAAAAGKAQPPAADAASQLATLIGQLAGAGQTLDVAAVKAIAAEAVAEAMKGFQAPAVTVTLHTAKGEIRDMGKQHKSFPTLLQVLNAGCHAWLAGPAGSGKTTAAEKAAEALGLPFSFNGALDTPYKVTGFVDAQGRIVSTPFRKAFIEGGLHLFDECDASLAPATLAINAALANGFAEFPDGQHVRHPKFLCVAAANTYGHGATAEYIGRNLMDKAFLDRFVNVPWDYDKALERHCAGNDEWVEYVQDVRAKVSQKGLKVVISPRASIFGARLLAVGMPREKVIELCLASKMTADQWKGLQA